MTNTDPGPGLRRGLTFWGATSVVVGQVIGTGVFLKARVMTCNVGSAEAVLAIWIVAGLLSLAGALSYAELAAMMPRTGGEYVFMREGYGKRWAFLYGWTQVVIGYAGGQAAKAAVIAIMINVLAGDALGGALLGFGLGGTHVTIGGLELAGVAAIWIVTVVNCAEISATNRILTVLSGVKALMVFGIGATVFALADGSWLNFAAESSGGACEGVSPRAIGGIAGFGAAMLGALWAYDGWSALSLVAGEVKDPQRNIPRALFAGMGVIITVYVIANAAYFYVLTPTEVADVSPQSAVATEVIQRALGAGAAAVMAACLLTSSAGSLFTGIMGSARISYAMAQDRIFFPRMGTASPRTHMPVIALLVQAVWMSVLTLSGSFDTLTDYSVFASWIFYGMVTASLFLFRRRFPDAERPYRTWGYPVVPGLFLVVTAWLLLNTLVASPGPSLIGVVLICLGLPLYEHFRRKER